MTGRDFSYAYFVSPLRYRPPDKQCGPGRYRGLTAFASLSMAVSGIGCRRDEYLCMGETHDRDWQKILNGLAALPYVEKIIPSRYE